MRIIFMLYFLLMNSAFADELSLGSVADNMTGPIVVVAGFMGVGCLIIGAGCIFASIVKYFEHRRSPLSVTLSKVVWLLVIGITLICLPFAYMLSGHGIPFEILWGGSAE